MVNILSLYKKVLFFAYIGGQQGGSVMFMHRMHLRPLKVLFWSIGLLPLLGALSSYRKIPCAFVATSSIVPNIDRIPIFSPSHTYRFTNLNSNLVLDDPAGSTTTGPG